MGEHRPDDGGAGGGGGGGDGRFYGWPSSRIVRVSRASGGKDRHSKILTSKGTRDRRVRLSVNTAIQFYDLQDRLGYDQPSKAVEWLLTAAASSIAELPPMNCSFLVNPKQLSSAKMSSAAAAGGFQLGLDSGEVEIGRGGGRGSGNSKNSKGLGLSISRSENRSEARETAKEKENESSYVASFTELLSGKMSSINGGGHNSNSTNPDALIHQDYFTSGLLGLPTEQNHHHELQPFSFSFSGDNNVVSSPAINRGTLQSNSPPSPSLLPRFPAADGGSPPNLFVGGGDHRHHFLSGFDARLQLYYGQKEEEKN